MKMAKRIKKGSALLLALTLILSGMAFSRVTAALGIETDRKCSVTFQVDGDLESEFAELAGIDIPVKVYKVADVSESGKYMALDGFESLDLESVTSETTAAEWEEKAAKATQILEETQAPATAEGLIQNGSGTIRDLSAGMYLAAAQEVKSETYAYKFTPYLISLPNNYNGTGNDDWVYDVTAGLKPGREDLFGKLVIDKTLTSFNASLGKATFVFQIEGVRDGESVYSDVVSIVFDGAGTKSVVIDKIPAGAEVTVTEIYSGASYELTSSPSQTVKIQASEEGEEGKEAHVSFTNDYNEKMNGGASVVNHFINNDGSWSVEQQPDSTQQEE